MDQKRVLAAIGMYQHVLESLGSRKMRMDKKRTYFSLSRTEILSHAHYLTYEAGGLAQDGRLEEALHRFAQIQVLLGFAEIYTDEQLAYHAKGLID